MTGTTTERERVLDELAQIRTDSQGRGLAEWVLADRARVRAQTIEECAQACEAVETRHAANSNDAHKRSRHDLAAEGMSRMFGARDCTEAVRRLAPAQTGETTP